MTFRTKRARARPLRKVGHHHQMDFDSFRNAVDPAEERSQFEQRANRLERYGFIILLLLLYTKMLNVILEYPLFIAQKVFFSMAGL